MADCSSFHFHSFWDLIHLQIQFIIYFSVNFSMSMCVDLSLKQFFSLKDDRLKVEYFISIHPFVLFPNHTLNFKNQNTNLNYVMPVFVCSLNFKFNSIIFSNNNHLSFVLNKSKYCMNNEKKLERK